MGAREKDRELERLIPLSIGGVSNDDNVASKSSFPADSPNASTSASATFKKEAFRIAVRGWAWKKFMTGCVILSPLIITFYITWWFIHFVDGIFSPIYDHLGINIFGLGFVTSLIFIFLVGVFMSSWVGTSLLALGEWFIIKMPLMSYIYAASKQISAAISPGSEELCCVYVPTNHLYLGDILLINSKDVLRPNLSVREGIEIVISGGMSIPKLLTTIDSEFNL
ncbi:protein LIKE COV 3 isoform X2 [Sesamum indicum]|uniref:Protein LIKE COV 3 isoform X2 n=1 Tax=Sesamum indicum TaxID=4182 RepID=A0A6I9UGF8_SESIN|nr:protein LIKE COV 3 isoform X2 [Sesamum indicum]